MNLARSAKCSSPVEISTISMLMLAEHAKSAICSSLVEISIKTVGVVAADRWANKQSYIYT